MILGTAIKIAPAKINLGLDVVGKREDGYHLLETVFQEVEISDTVTVSLDTDPGIVLTCQTEGVPCNEKNIAYKAAQRYLEAAGLTETFGVHIDIEKNIPMEAGMGGGSTDGAAVLMGLQELTKGVLNKAQLLNIATSLGADVPFFLEGGTVYAEGIGEKMEVLPTLELPYLVIAKGKQGVSTKEAYGAIDSLTVPNHPPVQQLKQAILDHEPLEKIASLCGNLFEDAVALPEVQDIRESMKHCGALTSVMTGSGAAVFGIFADAETARNAVQALQTKSYFVTSGWWMGC